jgi:hypothetical protein
MFGDGQILSYLRNVQYAAHLHFDITQHSSTCHMPLFI